MEKQKIIDQMYGELSFLKNFEREIHYSLKHIRRMQKDVILYTERLNNQYDLFKELCQKHLGISLEEAAKILADSIAGIQDDKEEK